MATVYSLVCWGGVTGKSVTMTIASPCVVTSTNHGLRNGTRLVFSTTGALPTGITAGTTYYAKSTAANTFNLYTDAALTSIVNTSGTQSGTHTAKSRLMLDYFEQYAGRWGDAGSERCYDGIAAWNTARSGALSTDEEVCEIGQAFTGYGTATVSITVPCGAYRIESKIGGGRTEAFHAGSASAGFVFECKYAYGGLTLTRPRGIVDGFVVRDNQSGYLTLSALQLSGFLTTGRNMIVVGNISSVSDSIGVELYGQLSSIENSLAYGFKEGIRLYQYVGNPSILNCIATKNTYGVNAVNTGGANGNGATVLNTISIGNTTLNWYATNVTNLRAASNNLGGAGEAWIYGSGTRIEVTEASPFSALFSDWTNNNFRPASASSPQVDAGVEYYGALNYDIAHAERPNYNNGGAEAFDIGCYEFDHGYGDHPAVAYIALTNIVSGSRVLITSDDTSAVIYNDVPGTSLTFETGYIGSFTAVVRKASTSPYYKEFTAGGTTVADQTTGIKVLQQLDE